MYVNVGIAGIADANHRQKQLLKEHFQELGSEGEESEEEDDREDDASSMEEVSEDEDRQQQVRKISLAGAHWSMLFATKRRGCE